MTSAEMLIKNDIKPSLLRVMIYDYLKSHRTHPTVDDIYNDLSPMAPTLSRTTVYNTVKLFCSSKIVKIITIDEQQTRYDACTDLHGHFLCSQCKKVYDFSVEEPYAAELDGFNTITKEVYYTGICKNCMNN